MPAEINTGGPRVLHHYAECPIPIISSTSIPQETQDARKSLQRPSVSSRQRTCSGSLLELDSSPEIQKRRFRRSKRRRLSEVVVAKTKGKVEETNYQTEREFSNISRIQELVLRGEGDFQVRPELRDGFEVANQRLSSTTCHVIANRSYRFSETHSSPKRNSTDGGFLKLKGGFWSAEWPWFDPRISWTTSVSGKRKLPLSSHPYSKGFVCSRSNRQVEVAPLNVAINPVHLKIDPLIGGIDPVNVDHLKFSGDYSSANRRCLSTVRKKRKRKRQCSSNRSYFQLAFLLFLIAFGQSGLLTSGVLSFHGKSTGLSVLTIGIVMGAVGAAPVDLIGDTGVRSERSANLSHITGASRKIQMYIKNRHLQILPDGTVNGSNDDTSDYSE